MTQWSQPDFVIAGIEASSSSHIKGAGFEGAKSEGVCESVQQHHDSTGGPAGGMCPPQTLLQQLCLGFTERDPPVPLSWVRDGRGADRDL